MKWLAFPVFLSLVLLGLATHGQVIVDRASTAGESYARGASDVIRARGDANLSNSQAAINAQDAYSKGIDNSVKSVQAYWERRDIYEQRQKDKLYEITQRRQRHMERHGLGYLEGRDFDRTTGAINWIGPLKQSQYSKYRETFDRLFQKRAEEGWLGSDDYLLASKASREWRQQIASERGAYPKNVSSQMVRFILKLDRELNDNLN